MPLTPRFSLSQNPRTLILTVRLPHVRVSASTVELVVDGPSLHLYSPPYLLRLTLPANLVDESETGREARATFDPAREDGTLTVTVHKEEEGTWEDLDLIGRLTQGPKGAGPAPAGADVDGGEGGRGKISVLSSTTEGAENEADDSGRASADGAAPVDSASSGGTLEPPRYGFLRSFRSVFAAYGRDGLSEECVELPDPDSMDAEERRETRLVTEGERFDEERYLGDLFLGEEDDDEEEGDMIYGEAAKMSPHWETTRGDAARGAASSPAASGSVAEVTAGVGRLTTKDEGDGAAAAAAQNPDSFFTPEEFHLLSTISTAALPSHALPTDTVRSLLLGLADILFAYAYDHRTTVGEPTVESSWTCSILSPTLSWFEEYRPPYDALADVLRWCIRRSLIYPYIRSYTFAKLIVTDVAKILSGGCRVVLRCMLQLRGILHRSEGHYLLNKLYVDPYVVWVQTGLEEGALYKFAAEVMGAVRRDGEREHSTGALGKECLGLGLPELERAALTGEEKDEEEEGGSDGSDEDESGGDGGGGDSSSADSFNDDGSGPIRAAGRRNSLDAIEASGDDAGGKDASRTRSRSSALLDERLGDGIGGAAGIGGLASVSVTEGAMRGRGDEAEKDDRRRCGDGVAGGREATKRPLIEEIEPR